MSDIVFFSLLALYSDKGNVENQTGFLYKKSFCIFDGDITVKSK